MAGGIVGRLQRDEWSMPAGEMFGAAMVMSAVTQRLSGVSHVMCFSDSISTVTAVTTGSSAAPQLNVTIRRLQIARDSDVRDPSAGGP